MSLLFGNLTQAFVTFGQAVASAQSGTPGAAETVSAAAAGFRTSASKDASYLVYIGLWRSYYLFPSC